MTKSAAQHYWKNTILPSLKKQSSTPKEWISFEVFVKDIGIKKGYLRKVDRSLGYTKQNLVWVTVQPKKTNKVTFLTSIGAIVSKEDREHPSYTTWESMLRRCYDTKNKAFSVYKDRKPEASWLNFKQFAADMGEKPDKATSLERKDNLKGYSKDNCTWATAQVQAKNRNRLDNLTYKGQQYTRKSLSKAVNIPIATLARRLQRNYSVEQAVTSNENFLRPQPKTRLIETYLYEGKAESLKTWCKQLGISYTAAKTRRQAGWSFEQILKSFGIE